MNTEIMSASGVGLEITQLLMPFVSALVLLVITLWFKDFATKIAKGLAFSMNKSFNEGDSVILDGQEAIIVKIGLSESVFGIYSDRGYTWRYVPNERIPILKLEKVINKDAFQDHSITHNKNEIEKIKNGK